ncbi:MAG: hypothetical protein COB24_01720 [Hyphomicrobiales bacterium]|nr:MAG: hypothetical protein COB24_01720 [Hyphomicrobiales bacterium]
MNIKADIAIVKKELIEHKGSLFFAPAILIALFFVLVTFQTLFLGIEDFDRDLPFHEVFIMAFMAGTAFFSIYMLITLFFYYADAFSADGKNNGLLFWKSLPMSDLRILLLKLLTGTIVIPLIILCWVVVSSVASYIIGVINYSDFVSFIAPWTALSTLLQLFVHLAVVLVIVLLWLAPFYAWVAMLSVFFKKWAIALAFVIPLVLITMEEIFSFDAFQSSYIGDFIEHRFKNIVDHSIGTDAAFNASMTSLDMDFDEGRNIHGATIFLERLPEMLWHFISHVRWMSLLAGLAVSGIFVYIGSEYRRRFIQG